jgi:hypothetical protein
MPIEAMFEASMLTYQESWPPSRGVLPSSRRGGE